MRLRLEKKIRQSASAPGVGLRHLLRIGLQHNERAMHLRIVLDEDLQIIGRLALFESGDSSQDDIGLLGAGELDQQVVGVADLFLSIARQTSLSCVGGQQMKENDQPDSGANGGQARCRSL